ncbi:MAG TPA: flagellar biosynthesis anti-sigma factor FlgM [Gemmataceae bacterium]|nr:flagellar biosynthesis anti-sigma factor FlgM [Gemmataceae bacterium]
MLRHGPTCLQGPVSLPRGRWAGLAPEADLVPGSDRPVRPDDPEVRTDLVERVRREIANGAYETPEKLEEALDRLIERLEWGG